ncbi:hypothetical protein DVH05_008656 [Phytophthora capsici]|nr:hypothetical protein DVH05_008656 [Phytophthora capsici]
MAHISLPPVNVGKTKFSKEELEIERFRAHHRCTHRGHQSNAMDNRNAESLDVEGGRVRKVSAKWRQRQHQTQRGLGFDDGIWPVSAGTEMHIGFNAFDFSACPEAFEGEELAVCMSQSYASLDQSEVETKANSHDSVPMSESKHRMYNIHEPPTYHNHYEQLLYSHQRSIA